MKLDWLKVWARPSQRTRMTPESSQKFRLVLAQSIAAVTTTSTRAR